MDAKVFVELTTGVPTKVSEIPWLWAFSTRYPFGTPMRGADKVGKWLVFCSSASIDIVWPFIKEATERDLLGPRSKVSTTYSSDTKVYRGSHVLCAYVLDSSNLKEVERVLRELRTLGIKRKLGYKTDQATLQGIYGTDSIIYHSTDFEKETK